MQEEATPADVGKESSHDLELRAEIGGLAAEAGKDLRKLDTETLSLYEVNLATITTLHDVIMLGERVTAKGPFKENEKALVAGVTGLVC